MKNDITNKGFAVVPEGTLDLCYTNTHPMLGGGSVYQIYRTKKDAEKFCKVPFGDAKYIIKEIEISFLQ